MDDRARIRPDGGGGCVVAPSVALRPFVHRMVGYRVATDRPGTHLGLPSSYLTLIVTLGDPITVSVPGVDDVPRAYALLVGGLHAGPVHIHHDGRQHGIQVDLTPAGARALWGCPAGELTGVVADLTDLLDRRDRALEDRAASAPDWPTRIAVVEQALTRRLVGVRSSAVRPEVGHAWELIRRSHGTSSVADLAAEVGWSARHLGARFRTEYGLTPKTAARVARFARSRELLGRMPLAEIAARCGYADQPHLNRDWHDLAGVSPGRLAEVDSIARMHVDD